MSRLFEALSKVEPKRRSPGVVPLTVVPPRVVRPETTAVEAAPPEPAQELEREHRSPDVVPLAAAAPDVVPLETTAVETAPPEPAQELEREHRSPDVDPLAAASPDVVPPEMTAVEAALPEPAQELEREHCSPDVVPLVAASPDAVPPVVTAVDAVPSAPTQKGKMWYEVRPKPVETLEGRPVRVKALPDSRIVALTDPNSLGAEKFRALATRLDYLRKQRELKSFQVTSSVINEGKTVVAGNVAVTLAKYFGSKTLLIEGDLHRPTLAALLGLSALHGLSHWWSRQDYDLVQYVHKLNDMPLWFLSAGKPCERPSDILRSARFAKAFAQLASQFEWIVVDSSPMFPIVDVNLWSRLVDGTLLVVREGVTPVKALKKGLQALDHPKLIGVVMNEASGSDQANYDGQYYGASKPRRVGQTR